ncbi:MAG TPA: SCO family protein [Balneolaceae bacterium]|nr:SCO family protein [Balneolaceae bacterium]
MNTALRSAFLIIFTAAIFISCNNPEVIKDVSDESYQLVNAQGEAVAFPDDYLGNISVITFIYTHCPDVCPLITANMKNIQSGLEDASTVNFIEISFDPQRDTPEVLKKYKELYELNDQFSLLTGDTASVHSLLEKLEITAIKVPLDSAGQDSGNYMMKHSNKIYLMDESGRIRMEYPASFVPHEHVVEDLKKLR